MKMQEMHREQLSNGSQEARHSVAVSQISNHPKVFDGS